MSQEDLPVEDDVVVRTALQLLPVPSHRASFWSDLDRALRASGLDAPGLTGSGIGSGAPSPRSNAGSEDVLRPVTQPVRVIDLDDDPSLKLVPPALRRRSNAVAAIAAVAAAVLVVVAGAALLRERSGTEVDTSEVAAPDPSTETSATATSGPPESSSPASDEPTAAVFSWIAAVEQGDDEAAWEAMGPGAKAYLGTKDELDSRMSGLAEGYGAWAAATPDTVLVTPLGERGDTTFVVTLIGEVEQEGVRQQRADAFVVRLVGERTEIEPFDAAGALEVVVPDEMAGPSQTVTDGELVVVVPEGADAPIVRLDDGKALVCGEAQGTELTELETAEGQRCSYRPEGGIPAGQRVLTVAFMAGGGEQISAESVLFEAA